jgi:hypothetical protein
MCIHAAFTYLKIGQMADGIEHGKEHRSYMNYLKFRY